jgi:hypothetical protein
MIDSLKDQYTKPIEMAKEEKITKEENNINSKVEKNDIKSDINEDDKNIEEKQHRSIGIFPKKNEKEKWKGFNIYKKCSHNIFSKKRVLTKN